MTVDKCDAGTRTRDEVKRRFFVEPDRDVWVVERNPGSGWRVSGVLGSYDDAERYRDDLRHVMNTYPEGFPEEFKRTDDVRIRHGSRKSGTPFFETYPPEEDRPCRLPESAFELSDGGDPVD